MHIALWWLMAAVVFGIIEVGTVDFVFLMLAGGALAAAGAAFLGTGFTWQVVVFAIVATLLLALVRPWIKRHLAHSVPNIQTNSRGLVGKVAVVTEPVGIHDGRVKLDGEIWSARCVGVPFLAVGSHVLVVSIDGATAVVQPMTQSGPSGVSTLN